jgi:molecular chaperone GrpE
LKELEGLGLEKVGVVGEPFDPNNHEAVGTVPVAEEASADTVATVLQMGYKIGTVLLRPAMVQVYM